MECMYGFIFKSDLFISKIMDSSLASATTAAAAAEKSSMCIYFVGFSN